MRISLLLLIGCLGFISAQSQDQELTSEQALEAYQIISDSMVKSFPEDDIKTYRRASFSENQLQVYVSQHFKRMDLLTKIQGHHALKLDSYLHSGNWFREIGFPKESIKSYIHFFDYYEAHEKELTQPEKANYVEMRNFAFSILAENYAKINDFKNADKTYQENIAFSKVHNKIYYPSALNNYGLFFYWHKADLDSAQYYFKNAYDVTMASYPNHTLIGSIRDNIADVYSDKKDYQKALPLYETNFHFYQQVTNEKTKERDVTRLISAGAQVIETSLSLGLSDNADATFAQLDHIVTSAMKAHNLGATSNLEFLEAKQKIEAYHNDFKAAYGTANTLKHYADSLHQVSDRADAKWREELNNITLDRVALNFQIDRIQKENKIKTQRSKLWIITLTSSVVLILLLSLFLRRRQHLINAENKQLLAEQTLENSQLKVTQLNSEIQSKARDLSDFAISLTQNQEWTATLAEKVQHIKTTSTKEREHLLQELEQDIKNKITFDADTKEFFERLDKLSDAFYSQLTERFSNLSKNEIRLCSLIRLKIDSRSIATLQNITLASLNTSRYRLRKKLDLPEDVDLDHFIQTI